MHARLGPSDGLRRLASLQAGVVTFEQVCGHGLSPKVLARLVDEGHWRKLARSVYLTVDTEPAWLALAWAGVLLAGDDARLGHGAAGHLHGLVDRAPSTITVVVPHGTQAQARGPWEFRRTRNGGASVGSPPRTAVAVTVLDLCRQSTRDDVVGFVTSAVQRRLTTPGRLRTALEAEPRHPHRKLILGLVADVVEGAESPLELAYLRDVERAHGLPRGRRQARSRTGSYVHDVAYDAQEVLVELDGRLGHEGAGRFRDMWRDNVSALDGHLTLRYGTADVYRRPCDVAHQVGGALAARGWAGLIERCRRCHRVA